MPALNTRVEPGVNSEIVPTFSVVLVVVVLAPCWVVVVVVEDVCALAAMAANATAHIIVSNDFINFFYWLTFY